MKNLSEIKSKYARKFLLDEAVEKFYAELSAKKESYAERMESALVAQALKSEISRMQDAWGMNAGVYQLSQSKLFGMMK